MRDYDRLLDQIEQFINKYNQIESSSRDYGAGVLLSRTEIHLIAAIGDNPGIGVNKLAVLKGVSDGAVSQMIRKLVQKNLVNKAISKESEAKVELTLTEKGYVYYLDHKEYHEKSNKKWGLLLDEFDDQNYEKIQNMLESANKMLD